MKRSKEVLLEDILLAIGEIKTFLLDINDFDDYCASILTKRAVERDLAIIGEAVNNLTKLYPEINITNKKYIIGFRNILVHDYADILDETIWDIVITKLIVLEEEVNKLL